MDSTIVAAIVSAFAAIIAALITANVKDKSYARQEKERAELLKSGSHSNILTPEEYGVEILSPLENQEVKNSFKVEGTIKYLPEGYTIWTSTYGLYKDGDGKVKKRYWPQQPAKIYYSPKLKTWESKINNIGSSSSGEEKSFLVFVVGPDGQALFRYFSQVGKFTDSWYPLTELTSDVVECKKVSIISE